MDYSEYRTATADPAVEAITTGRDYFTSSLRSQKGRGLPSGVTRWDVLRAVKLARKSLGLSAAVLGYMEFLIEHTFDQDRIGTAAPIVFLAVQSSAQHFGVTPRQINSYERCLANCGLLTWRDASNRRRYGKRRKDGSLLFGFGVDLSPLVERYQDIIAIGEADRLELELWNKSRANVRSYRRVLSAGVVCIRDNGLLSEAAQEAEALIATLPDRHVEIELGEVAAKLDQRFGERAFMAGIKPEGPAFEKAAVRVASEDKAKLADAWPKFNAIQKIAANRRSLEQAQARALKKDRSKDQGMVR